MTTNYVQQIHSISFKATVTISIVTFAILVYAFVSTVFFGPASTTVLPGLLMTIALIAWTLSAYLFLLWLLCKDYSMQRMQLIAVGSLIIVSLSAMVLMDAFLLRPHPQSALVLLFLPVLQWVGITILILVDSVISHKEIKDKPRTRWIRLKPLFIMFLLTAVSLFAGWWFLQTPSNARNWIPNLAKLPYATFEKDSVTIQNVRNTQYLTADDYTTKYHNRTYDLSQIKTVEFVVVPFSSVKIAAHTFLVFGFEDGQRLAITVEVRREQGESYSPLRGMLRQCEIIYVIAEERDVILLRTKYRQAEVHLYPIVASPEKVREMFLSMLHRANGLYDQPEFYNTLTNNCTSNILLHFNEINKQKLPANLKLLFPGYSDQLAYDLNLVDNTIPFEQLQKKCDITKKANYYADDIDFSKRIRE